MTRTNWSVRCKGCGAPLQFEISPQSEEIKVESCKKCKDAEIEKVLEDIGRESHDKYLDLE